MMRVACLLLALGACSQLPAQQDDPHAAHDHAGHAMSLDRDGMTMNSNSERLPQDCSAVSADIDVQVRVGVKHALRGQAFGFDRHEWRVPPCARLKVTLVNDDEVRHQWMVHGLPRYLYPQGMFHLEASGGRQRAGTLIVPSDHATYLVHCDIAQHMEHGLKAQLIVGRGSGTLPGVPGISAARRPERYQPFNSEERR